MPETNPAEVIIGVDTHKHTHAAVALTALGARLGTITVPASRRGYQELEAWAGSFGPVRAYGVEAGQTHEGLRSSRWGPFGEVTGAETLQNPAKGGISEQIANRP